MDKQSKKTYQHNPQFKWESAVRAYEIDVQGIVNNAHYLHYFDHARVQALLSCGIDWGQWSEQGLDLVLIHVDMAIKAPLRAHEQFAVLTNIEKSGKLRLVCSQKIIRKNDNTLIAEAKNTVVCISRERGKPVFPEALNVLLTTNRNKDIEINHRHNNAISD